MCSTAIMRIEKKSSLTSVSGCISPALFCVEVVDRKLKNHIALGEDVSSVPHSFRLMHSDSSDISVATTIIFFIRVSMTASPNTTAAPSSSGNRIAKRKRPYRNRREVDDCIASRLPARSRATMHRRFRTAIGLHFPPRTMNRATSSWICQRLRP